MTREVRISRVFSEGINNGKRIEGSTRKNTSVRKADDCRSITREKNLALVSPKELFVGTLLVFVGLARLMVYLAICGASRICRAWEDFQEKCGDEIREMGTRDIFGEPDGYYHTDEGFRLRASAIKIIPSKKRG